MLVIGLSLLASIVTATLGIMRAGSGGYEAKTIEVHRLFGLAVPFLTVLTFAFHRKSKQSPTRTWVTAYRAALICSLGALVTAGHYGGNLTHGSKYLVQNAPGFIKHLIESERRDIVCNDSQRFFLEKIRPLFEARCIGCHGPAKQKGNYRLDHSELATKGGSSGEPAITPGDPMSSEIVRRIMLPRDDDEVMPPDGKEQLTAQEVMDIVHWIHDGATFNKPDSLEPASVIVNH